MSLASQVTLLAQRVASEFKTVRQEFKGITINAQTGTTYTLSLTDLGKLVTLTNASPITLVVPTNATVAFPVGSRVQLSQMLNGQVTVSPASGVVVNSASGLKLAVQYAGAELTKTGTDTWLLIGRTVA